MIEFLIELDKFYQTYKLETEFRVGFHKKKQKVQILKFIQKLLEFEPNSKLKMIWFELIQRKMKNFTIHSGLAVAHSYRGSLGQGQLARPTARPLVGPCQRARPTRARCAVTTCGGGRSGTMVSSSPAKRWRRPRVFWGEMVTGRWPTCGYIRTQNGRLGRGCSPGGSSTAACALTGKRC
jgi:hypothetical protein